MARKSSWVQAPFMLVGYFLLIPFCLLRFWEPCLSTVNPFGRKARIIDRWRWKWLNTIYGNPEDGVSGQAALVWDWPAHPGLVPYRPNTWAPLRAWLWSAWRNSTNQLNR